MHWRWYPSTGHAALVTDQSIATPMHAKGIKHDPVILIISPESRLIPTMTQCSCQWSNHNTMFWKLREGPAKYWAESLAIAFLINYKFSSNDMEKINFDWYISKKIVIMRKQRDKSTIKSTIASVAAFKHDEWACYFHFGCDIRYMSIHSANTIQTAAETNCKNKLMSSEKTSYRLQKR